MTERDPSEAGAGSRPNVVVVLLDDVRTDDLDRPFVDLPHIDRLREEAADFRNGFTVVPLCSPSRAALLTGQYPHNNTIVDNRERGEESHLLVTFPRLLHDAGYRTGFVGKWHMDHDDDTRRPGFDRWVSFEGQGEYFDPPLNVDGERGRADGYITDVLSEHSVDFVEEVSEGEAPFALVVAHKAVHPELDADGYRRFPPAPRDAHLYDGVEVELSPAAEQGAEGKPALARTEPWADPRAAPSETTETVVRDRLEMVSSVDEAVGDLLRALRDAGELEDTLFVLTSDQGFFYGEFGLEHERRLAYEPSIRVPMVVRYPELADGGTRPAGMALNIDVAPTALELAGLDVPAWMEGRSLVPLLRDGERADWREEFLVEYYSDEVFPRTREMGYRAVRTERYKYVRYEELRRMDELYDLERDPHEMRNLLSGQGDAEYRIRRLRERLDERLDDALEASMELPAARSDVLGG
ncbi:MAG: sulfatase-like hydrolase/transferase [Candidatus Palauibacterales bacterium]|nr:sulfatase-like hydrolase/transferase [Candidatus Palauibacterales bacterium]